MSSRSTINIKNKKIEISDRFTLILGDFREENFPHEYDGSYEIINEFKRVPIRKFLELIDKIFVHKATMQKSVALTQYIKNYVNSINLNLELIEKYFNIISSLQNILKYQKFVNTEKQLLKELQIARAKNKSSDIAAETDLINKLKSAISENRTKLKYREEEFFHIKNQRDQIFSTLEDYQSQINELIGKKKQAFNQINQITREMSKSQGTPTKKNLEVNIGANKDMSKSKIIRSLQKKARVYQEDIRILKSKISEVKFKLNELDPKYENLKHDYETLLGVIESDQNKLNQIKEKLDIKMEKIDHSYIIDDGLSDIDSVRQPKQIKEELDTIRKSLNTLKKNTDSISESGGYNLEKIQDKLSMITELITSDKNQIKISVDKKKIIDAIENFRNFEFFINHLQDAINDFLGEINLELSLNILPEEKLKQLLIDFQFVRSNKETQRFEELTTPEKVFFAISFYIALKIVSNHQRIVFSNRFLPEFFNKRGSIFRTIRKMIPVLINKKKYHNFSIIFIISNLEMKKPIENLTIKKL